MLWRTPLLTILFCCLQFLAFSQRTHFKPVDKKYKDPSLAAYIDTLQKTVEQKNILNLLKLIHPGIKNGFGGVDGIENFKKDWRIYNSKTEIWTCLTTLLNIGGAKTTSFSDDDFAFPYTFSLSLKELPDSVDLMTVGFIIGSNIIVREKPSTNSHIIKQLSYEVVKTDFEKSKEISGSYFKPYDWYAVSTLDGQVKGYVPSQYYQSLIGWRLILSKRNGAWRIIALLAGD